MYYTNTILCAGETTLSDTFHENSGISQYFPRKGFQNSFIHNQLIK